MSSDSETEEEIATTTEEESEEEESDNEASDQAPLKRTKSVSNRKNQEVDAETEASILKMRLEEMKKKKSGLEKETRKRKTPAQKTSNKKRKEEPEASNVNEGEKNFDDEAEVKDKDDKTVKTKKGKKEAPLFNDKNLDYNLFSSDPDNVVPKKIKVSNSVLVTCKMIEAGAEAKNGGLAYDYAALTIQRKTKADTCFEFNLPLSLTPNLIQALKLIMKDNPRFFEKHGGSGQKQND